MSSKSVYSLLYFQAELEEREERRRMQELREQERRQVEEKERLLEQKQVWVLSAAFPVCSHGQMLMLCAALHSGGAGAPS